MSLPIHNITFQWQLNTYNGDLGTGTLIARAFLYQSVAKLTNDATLYLGML